MPKYAIADIGRDKVSNEILGCHWDDQTAGFPGERMRKSRVYIAGPMTGLPDYNFPAFNAAAATGDTLSS
jgi:hypothetical protein